MKYKKEDSLGELLDHVKILANSISKLELPQGLNLSNQENALKSQIVIEQMKEQIKNYQRIARQLNSAILNTHEIYIDDAQKEKYLN